MKKVTRLMSAVLSAALLTSVVTVAPFSVNAADEQDIQRDSAVHESKVEYAVGTASVTDFNDNKNETSVDDVVISRQEPTESIVTQSNKSVEAVGASEEHTSGDYKYTVSDGKATITGYLGTDEKIIIPNSIEEYDVSSIGSKAFVNKIFIKQVDLPSSLESIGSEAFSGCTSLETIFIPQKLSKVNGYSGVFTGCTNLKTAIIEDGYETLPRYLFYNCPGLETVDLPESLTTIESEAFRNCTSLTSITIPKNVSKVNGYSGVFTGCTNLKTAIVEEGVEKIPTNLFNNCPGLETVDLPESLTTIESEAFRNCTSLTSITIPKNVSKVDGYYGVFTGCSNLREAVFENGATSIPNLIFANCPGIETVNIPDSVKTIGGSAFINCKLIKQVDLPSSLESIGSEAFSGCTSLESIFIPQKLSKVNGYYGVFTGCTNLKTAIVEEGFEKLPTNLFNNCPGLETVNLPESLTTIESEAFHNCTSLTSITIPKNVSKVDGYYGVFTGCTDLKTVTFEQGVEKIPNRIMQNCTGLEIAIIPDSVTEIGNSAFEGCSSLSSCVLPNTVSKINDYVFKNCTSLANVVLPSNLTSLGGYSFENCLSINSIVIPKSLTATGNAFNGCKNLKTVTFEQGTEKLLNGIMQNCTGLEIAIIPDSVTEIGNSAFEGCSSLSSCVLPNTISKINDYAFKNCTSLADVVLPSNLTSLGRYSFENCLSINSIVIPKSLTATGNAFNGCKNLKTVTFEKGTEKIPNGIMQNCTGLEIAIMPDSVTEIGNSAFEGCINLSSCAFPNTISKINDHAFKNCTSLAEVVLPSNLTSLGRYSFENCSSINSIVIPKSLTSTENAFYGCKNLKIVTFEQGTEKIPNGIMQNCTGLESAIIPDSVTEIGSNSFYGCVSLLTMELSDSILFIGNNAFSNCANLQQLFLGDNIGSVGGVFTNNSNSAIIYVNYGSLTASTLFNAKIDYQFNEASDKKYNFLNYGNTVFEGEFKNEVAFTCNYSIKNNYFNEMSEKKLIFRLPDGVEVVKGTVKINSKVFNGYNMSKNFLTVPITSEEASVSFCVTVSAKNSLRVYAGFMFTSSESKKQTEIIDAVDFDLPLSANYDNISTDGHISIEGTAPVNQDVTVLVNGQEIAVLLSNEIGKISGDVTLPTFNDGDIFSVKLISTNRFGKELSQQGNVRIMQNRPSVSSFTLEYNGTSYDLMSEGSEQINVIAYTDDNPQPMRFVIKMNNTSEVDSIDVVSVKSDEKEYMIANWDESENAFVAEGYFCEDNKAYIPGQLQLYINKQQTEEIIDKNWVDTKIQQELPSSLQEAQLSKEIDTESSKKYTITLQDGSEVVYRYNRLNYDEAITQYSSDLGENTNGKNSSESVGAIAEESVSVNTKLIQLCTRYGWTLVSGYLDKQTGQQKDIYTTTIENDTEIITYFYDTTTDFIVKEAVSTAKSKTKSFILNTLLGEETASTLGTMKSIYSLATTEMDYTVNYMSDIFSLKEMEYQIKQDNSLSASQKEQKLKAIQEYKTDKHAILMFKMVGSYFQSVGSFAMSADPPVGIALWCVGFAMEKVIPYFIEHKEYFEKAKLFIDTKFPTLSIMWDICKSGSKEENENDNVDSLENKYTYISGSAVNIKLRAGQSIHFKCFNYSRCLGIQDYDIGIWWSDNYYCSQTVYDIRDGSLLHQSTGKEELWSGGILWNVELPEMDLSVYYGEINIYIGTTYGLIGYYTTGCPSFSEDSEPTEETIYKSNIYTHNGHDYQYINYAGSYDDAKQWCESNGGHLVTVSSEDENEFITQVLSENNATLIATNSQIENDGQLQYVSIANDGTWTKEPTFESPVSFICEWDYSSAYQIGDTNLDGHITIRDVTAIQRHIAELEVFTDEQLALADTNGDGEINISDATHLQMYLAEFDNIVLGKS